MKASGTLKTKMESLERDVGGLEAIVQNLDSKLEMSWEFNIQVWDIFQDARRNRPFMF